MRKILKKISEDASKCRKANDGDQKRGFGIDATNAAGQAHGADLWRRYEYSRAGDGYFSRWR